MIAICAGIGTTAFVLGVIFGRYVINEAEVVRGKVELAVGDLKTHVSSEIAKVRTDLMRLVPKV